MQLFDAAGRQLAYSRPHARAGRPARRARCRPTATTSSASTSSPTPPGSRRVLLSPDASRPAPWIDAVFPPMIEPGKAAQVTLYGRNLPGGKPDPAAVIDGTVLEKLDRQPSPRRPIPPPRRSSTSPAIVPPVHGAARRLRVSPADAAGPVEPGPAHLRQGARWSSRTTRTTRCETAQDVAGRRARSPAASTRSGDRDWYAFTAKKGDTFIIEMISHRLGAPTDMYRQSLNADAKTGGHRRRSTTTPKRSAPRASTRRRRDPAPYRFTAPADGKYHLLVGSHLGDSLADPTHIYRLRITPEKPDFRLIVMPADDYRPDAVRGRPGGHAPLLRLRAARMDGFKGDITLTMEGLPAGVTCPPQVLGADHEVRRTWCVARRRQRSRHVHRRGQGQRHGGRSTARRWSAKPGRRRSPGPCSRSRTSRPSPGSIAP